MIYAVLILSLVVNVWLLRRPAASLYHQLRERRQKGEIHTFADSELDLDTAREGREICVFSRSNPNTLIASLAFYETAAGDVGTLAWYFKDRSVFRGLRVPADTFVLPGTMTFVSGRRFRKKYHKKETFVRSMTPIGGFKHNNRMRISVANPRTKLIPEDDCLLDLASQDPPEDDMREAIKQINDRDSRLKPDPNEIELRSLDETK